MYTCSIKNTLQDKLSNLTYLSKDSLKKTIRQKSKSWPARKCRILTRSRGWPLPGMLSCSSSAAFAAPAPTFFFLGGGLAARCDMSARSATKYVS